MKITLPTDTFKTTLAKLANPPGEEPVHIGTLAVVITASEFEGISLRRTTANANIVTGADGTTETDGECGVGYMKLADVIKGCRGAQTELTLEGDTLWVKSGKREASIKCFNPDDLLPALAAKPAIGALEFLSTDLEEQIATVLPAASTNDAQPHLAGVCLRVQQGKITVFAVDGRRFHLRFLQAGDKFLVPHEGKDSGVMLAGDTVAMLRRLISGPETRVGLQVAENSITARCGQVCAILPLGATTPPFLEAYLPWVSAPDHKATCNRAELLQAVRDAAPLGFQDDKVITVHFTPTEIIIVADNEQGVAVKDPIDAKTTVTKGRETYRIKAQWFAEMIDQTKGETIELEAYVKEHNMLCTRAEDRLLCVLLTRDHVAAKA